LHPLIHFTQPREVVLPKVYLKLIQLHQQIRFTSTATAEAATAQPQLCQTHSYCRNSNIRDWTWKIKINLLVKGTEESIDFPIDYEIHRKQLDDRFSYRLRNPQEATR
jgi:hypothetical protein